MFRRSEFYIDDNLDSVHVKKDKYSLYFKGEDNNFERHAYYRISGDLLKPGELTVTLPVVKRQDLSVSAGGDFGVQIELFYKKPGRYKDDIYDCPDSLLYFPVPAGSGKYQQVTQTFVLPDNVACAFYVSGGTHFSGECWVEAPRLVQNKKQVCSIPLLSLPIRQTIITTGPVVTFLPAAGRVGNWISTVRLFTKEIFSTELLI